VLVAGFTLQVLVKLAQRTPAFNRPVIMFCELGSVQMASAYSLKQPEAMDYRQNRGAGECVGHRMSVGGHMEHRVSRMSGGCELLYLTLESAFCTSTAAVLGGIQLCSHLAHWARHLQAAAVLVLIVHSRLRIAPS
jgi:hypothetical protein